MGLKMFVKVSGITNLSEARYCAGMGVNLLGFQLEASSEKYVSPEKFKEITDWVAGVEFVGEFESSASDAITSSCEQYAVKYIQVTDFEVATALAGTGKSVIIKTHIDASTDLNALKAQITNLPSHISHLIIELDNVSLSEQLSTTVLHTECRASLIRAFDVTPETVKQMDAKGSYMGIELKGPGEDRPGFNNYDHLMDILEILEEDY